MPVPPSRRLLCAVLVAGSAIGLSLPVAAAAGPEEELAERYAPVVRLVEQEAECGPGEPYEPSDIDAFLDEETVSLRGPWRSNDLVGIAPGGGDLGRGLFEYNLDFPGDALDPGCDYERWARRVTADTEPTVYAHVTAEAAYPGRLALQYWLYYPFNDWNNTHEGDWEMIQLHFDASDATAALETEPVEVGYSQHEGAERAAWDDDRVELVDRSHPVVYPAAGSHANFYVDGLHIGRSASEGVGCDDTRGPHRDVRPVVRTIPSDPDAALAAYPWIVFEGRWGERQEAFFNGPTGPNLKTQWTKPFTWAEDWRDRSYAVPAGGILGTEATDFFCGAIGSGSNALRTLASNPGLTLAVLGIVLGGLLLLLTRTAWRPTAPLRLARRRSWGQTLTASARMVASRPLLFLGIGVITIPISILVTAMQSGLIRAGTLLGVRPDGAEGGARVALLVGAGTVLTLFGLALVYAACARALVELDARRPVGVLRAYSLALESVRPLLGALAIAVVVVALLGLSLFLIPVAVFVAIGWALIAPVAAFERRSALQTLRRSGSLVRRQWLKVATLVIASGAVALAAGPLLGALLLLAVPGAPIELVNVVAGLVYAVAMPFVGVTTTYVYFDTLVREGLDEGAAGDELPAEISLG